MTRVGMRGGEGGGGRKEEFLRVETSNASRSLTVHTKKVTLTHKVCLQNGQ